MAVLLGLVKEGFDAWTCIITLLLVCGRSQSVKLSRDLRHHPQEDAMVSSIILLYSNIIPCKIRDACLSIF
jgi:hypothetical protein